MQRLVMPEIGKAFQTNAVLMSVLPVLGELRSLGNFTDFLYHLEISGYYWQYGADSVCR
jgi:hypothetical protein